MIEIAGIESFGAEKDKTEFIARATTVAVARNKKGWCSIDEAVLIPKLLR
jgi:hypothetical protein